jgi:uncharacterized membrane protein
VQRRIAAIDWVRGLAMVLMAVDHASANFNAGRLLTDSAFLSDVASGAPYWTPGAALPADQFLTRWITHLCAPTFVFLSGTSLALSAHKRALRGGERAVDRHLLIRGLVLLALEATWLSIPFLLFEGVVVLQVIYAIAIGLLLMIPLRRLPTGWLVAASLAWLAGGELLTTAVAAPGAPERSLAAALSVAPGRWGALLVTYPALPWLAMMMLGFALGRVLLRQRARGDAVATRLCGVGGLAAIGVFALVRGANGYGNMLLARDDGSLLQWLHVSKYPPSLAFSALELGLMGLLLAACLGLEARLRRPPRARNPVLVLGQTALFFYLLHLPLLAAAAMALGRFRAGGLFETFLAAGLALALLYPACLWYRRYKAAHPRGWPQYI